MKKNGGSQPMERQGPRSAPCLTWFETVCDWRAWSDEAGRRAHLDPISVLALPGIP